MTGTASLGVRLRHALWQLVKWGLIVAALCLLLSGIAVGWALLMRRAQERDMYENVALVPPRSVAIVLGAGVLDDGRPSAVLADRVHTACELYKTGKVRKLLMTGDNRFVDYNEPQSMKEYALNLGVPAEDIVLDYAGRRTYDSCYRALHIFQVPDAIIVTQRFHLPRALLIADGLGLEAIGMVADRRPYYFSDWYNVREIPATLVAWWQSHITRPEPVLGEKLPIFVK